MNLDSLLSWRLQAMLIYRVSARPSLPRFIMHHVDRKSHRRCARCRLTNNQSYLISKRRKILSLLQEKTRLRSIVTRERNSQRVSLTRKPAFLLKSERRLSCLTKFKENFLREKYLKSTYKKKHIRRGVTSRTNEIYNLPDL